MNDLMSKKLAINTLLKNLRQAISQRKYDELEQIGHLLLDLSPTEEADCCLHEIITSATTIRDAEDEIRYQLEDLHTILTDLS